MLGNQAHVSEADLGFIALLGDCKSNRRAGWYARFLKTRSKRFLKQGSLCSTSQATAPITTAKPPPGPQLPRKDRSQSLRKWWLTIRRRPPEMLEQARNFTRHRQADRSSCVLPQETKFW